MPVVVLTAKDITPAEKERLGLEVGKVDTNIQHHRSNALTAINAVRAAWADLLGLADRLGVSSDRGTDIRNILAKFRPTTEESALSPFVAGAPDLGGGEAATEDGGSFEVRYVAQRDASDAQVGWIVRIVDISPLKQAERHREEALQLLSHDMRAPQSVRRGIKIRILSAPED